MAAISQVLPFIDGMEDGSKTNILAVNSLP
jgi:hypothetical protein